MNQQGIQALKDRVQHNCDISDARHGGDYSLCIYLMKMREYYRWEKGLAYGASLPREDVGQWLSMREQLWERIEEDDFLPLELGGEELDPFDASAINQHLEPHDLVYSAGLGRYAQAHFFLGHLRERQQRVDGYSVLISGREYARDLGAPPAMTQGDTIFIRRESLRRMLWEKLESWRWNRPDNALGRAFACYDFERDLEGSLDVMTDVEIEAALLHEQGEYQAGQLLGEDWDRLVLAVAATPAELMLRSVRDHLADCLVTLPALAEANRAASIHFYLGNLTHMRKEIFPGLDSAYRDWCAGGSSQALGELARQGAAHWRHLALEAQALPTSDIDSCRHAVEELVRENYL